MTDPGLGDRLALELEDQPQHAVRRRVLRAHVDDEPLLVVRVVAEDEVPVAAGDGVDPALGGLARAGVRVGVRCHGACVIGRPSARPAAGSSRPCTPPGCRRAGSPCAAGGRPSRRA